MTHAHRLTLNPAYIFWAFLAFACLDALLHSARRIH
jgi:hypothetical protein